METLIETGVLPHAWRAYDPAVCDAPPFETHAYNENLYILRQSGLTHYEKPFLYLLFGARRALLIDTGAGHVDVAGEVASLLGSRPVELVVAHSHSHDDHVAGDDQFRDLPGVTVVPPTLDAILKFFGVRHWPDEIVQFDLGGRVLDVIPIPGHDETSVAFYDRRTAVLLAGDTLYPGRLYVEDGGAFRASIRRLVEFTADRPIAHILGCHIENSRTPFVDYPVGTVYQPDEHSLELGRAHLLELDAALREMPGKITQRALRDVTIWPR